MKKLLALALVVFGLAACQTEPEGINVDANGEAAVTLTVAVPDIETRVGGESSAIGAFGNVDFSKYDVRYILEVYNLDGTLKEQLAKERMVETEDEAKETSFTLRLIPGRDYRFVVWADLVEEDTKTDLHYKTTDLKDIQLTNLLWNLSDETRDAYTGYKDVDEFKSTSNIRIELKRPLGKLRVVTTDIKDMFNVLPEEVTVEYTSDIYTKFNAFTSQVISDSKAVVVNPKTIKISENKYANEWAVVDGVNKVKENLTLFADYYFAADEQEPISFTLDVKDNNGMSIPQVVFSTPIPIQRNYLTTVMGPVLTDANSITVVVNDAFENGTNWNPEDDKFDVDIWDGKSAKEPKFDAEKNAYLITTGAELAWIADQVNGVTRAAEVNTFKGKNVLLMNDINLNNEPWTPIGTGGYTNNFNGTFDGQGNTIANLQVNNTTCAGLIGGTTSAHVKNLTIDGVDLTTNHYAGAIIAWAESGATNVKIEGCTVKNAKITVTPELVGDKYDNGDKAGAIIGFSHVALISGCAAENVVITAFRDVAAIAGYANKGTVKNCTVKNATITSDQIIEYNGEKDGNAGVFVGRIGEAADTTGNTEGENVVVIRKVDSTKEMEYAVADAKNGDTIYVGNGEVALPHFESKALNFVGEHANAAIAEPVSGHIDAFWQGAELNFTDLKIKGTSYTGSANGYVKSAKETYTNCKFVDGYYMFAGDVVTVDNGVFTGKYNSYFWTGSADEITFNKCKFNAVERAVKVCTVGHTGVERKVNFTECEFNATELKKAAIEIDGTKGSSYIVNINNCTETGFAKGEFTDMTMFNVEGAENVEVHIDGNKYAGKGLLEDENGNLVVNSLDTLETALKTAGAAGAGDTTIVFAENTTLNMTNTEWTPIKVDGYHGADIVTIEGNGAVITGLKAPLFAGGFAGGSGIVIKDLTIKDSNIVSANTLGSGAFIESIDSMDKIELTNCHLLDSTVTGGAGSRTGGLIGWTAGYNNQNDGPVKTYVTIDNCSVVGCTIQCDGSVGGINGHAGNNAWTYTTIKNCTITNNKLISTDDGEWRTGVVVGTANVGEVTISNITESGNTLTQTGKTAPEGFKRNYYGRFVPGTTGKLTIDGEEVVMINTAEKLVAAIEDAKAGDTITIAGDITLTEALTLPAGIIFNGNGKQINGTLVAGGDIAFAGHTKVTAFSASYYNRTITIGKGACLEITGTGRTSLAYGNTFDITGNVSDAKSTDKANVQPSLIISGGISITGGNDAVLNIKDAYVQIGSTTSKNNAANGTFTINIENSIAEFTNQLTFSEPTSGMNPTFNLNVKNSVLTTATKLILAAPNTNMVVDNSTVTIASYFRNSGNVELKNGSVLTGETIQFGENGGHDGTTTVDASKFTIKATSTGHAYDGRGTGSITLKNGAEVSVDYYKDLTINSDANSTFTGTEVF